MTIAGMNACVQRNVPVAFTASTRFQSSSVILPSGALCAAPALLTRISTTPARRAAAWARLCTLAASVTSHCTAHALPPPSRISAATFSMRSAPRAATTIAAPSAARARATAAPIPWPPPVTTATAPSNLRKHGLLEDRTQRVNETRALAGGGGGGVAKVSAWTTGFLERSFARTDRVKERGRVGRQSAPDRLADGRGTLAEDDRALELARVTRAAFEFLSEPQGPRLLRQVGEDDRQQPIGASELHGFVQRREMLRVEMGIGDRQQSKPLLRQAARQIHDDGGDCDSGNGQRAVKRGAEAGRGIGERGQNHAVIPPCREPHGSRSGHGTGDQDVGLEREMRFVRFDGSDGQYR